MNAPAGQIILFLYCVLTAFLTENMEFFSLSSVIVIILSIILSSLSYFLLNKYFTLATSGIYVIISLAFPGFTIMFPLILYNVNKDDNCKEPLDNLHEALDQAMTSIRESVHNLHNESVNLQDSMEKIITNFNFCNINFTYDMGTDVPREIKLSFISIVKEGLNNIYKHSNATDASILLREHPAMYQLVIKDNGTTARNADAREYILETSGNSGIGINNISSRVSLLNGSLQIHTDNGFCIFITIPKT